MMDKHKKLAMQLQKMGRNGDSLLAHLNPKEAQLLNRVTDGGSINPKTGLLEFYDGSSEDNDAPDNSNPSGGEFGNEGHDIGYGMAEGGSWSDYLRDMGLEAPSNDPDRPISAINEERNAYSQGLSKAAEKFLSGLDQDPQGPSSYVGDNGIGANSYGDVFSGGDLGNVVGYTIDQHGPQIGSAIGQVAGTLAGGPLVGALMSALGRGAAGGTVPGSFGQLAGQAVGAAVDPFGIGGQLLGSYSGAKLGDNLAAGYGVAAPGEAMQDPYADAGTDPSQQAQASQAQAGYGAPSGGGFVAPGRIDASMYSGVGSRLGNLDPVTLSLADALMRYGA